MLLLGWLSCVLLLTPLPTSLPPELLTHGPGQPNCLAASRHTRTHTHTHTHGSFWSVAIFPYLGLLCPKPPSSLLTPAFPSSLQSAGDRTAWAWPTPEPIGVWLLDGAQCPNVQPSGVVCSDVHSFSDSRHSRQMYHIENLVPLSPPLNTYDVCRQHSDERTRRPQFFAKHDLQFTPSQGQAGPWTSTVASAVRSGVCTPATPRFEMTSTRPADFLSVWPKEGS